MDFAGMTWCPASVQEDQGISVYFVTIGKGGRYVQTTKQNQVHRLWLLLLGWTDHGPRARSVSMQADARPDVLFLRQHGIYSALCQPNVQPVFRARLHRRIKKRAAIIRGPLSVRRRLGRQQDTRRRQRIFVGKPGHALDGGDVLRCAERAGAGRIDIELGVTAARLNLNEVGQCIC